MTRILPSGLYTRGFRCSGGIDVATIDLSRTIPTGVNASFATFLLIVAFFFFVSCFGSFGSPITIDRLMDKCITPDYVNIALRMNLFNHMFHFKV